MGKAEIKIDGSQVALFNLNAASTYNVRFSQAGIVVAASGIKTIVFGVNGSTSGSYYMAMTYLIFYRTA